VSALNELTVDLEAQEISHPAGLRVPFELDPYARETLIGGLDDIARTLKREDKIAAYEARALSG
jgi:3-isopropylmalate/(R)-2-methylmalate dehydratase small subunit